MMEPKISPPPKREAPPQLADTPIRNLDKKSPLDVEPMNFRVEMQFKREYKGYAVARGMTMVELLRASFDLYREKHGY